MTINVKIFLQHKIIYNSAGDSYRNRNPQITILVLGNDYVTHVAQVHTLGVYVILGVVTEDFYLIRGGDNHNAHRVVGDCSCIMV